MPAADGEWLTLECHGTLDAQQTDVAYITALMAKATGKLANADPAITPHFYYAATHVLDRATGLPRHVELRMYGLLADSHNKLYSLTISRPP